MLFHREVRIHAARCIALAAGLCVTAFACGAVADVDAPLRLVRSWTLTAEDLDAPGSPHATHRLRLAMVVMREAGWSSGKILDATRRAVRILAQCRIRTTFVELGEFDGPARYRHLATPASRELAGRLRLERPAVFFVADTLNRPAFDAEAVGRGNSRFRPEMADTVWITAAARDIANVIAHELAHVLADSGAHSDLPGNLMREDTAPESTALTPDQCRRITASGTANGLLQAEKP